MLRLLYTVNNFFLSVHHYNIDNLNVKVLPLDLQNLHQKPFLLILLKALHMNTDRLGVSTRPSFVPLIDINCFFVNQVTSDLLFNQQAIFEAVKLFD